DPPPLNAAGAITEKMNFTGEPADAVSKLIIENSIIPTLAGQRFRRWDRSRCRRHHPGGVARFGGMEGACQTAPGRPARHSRPADISVLHGDLVHDRGRHRKTRSVASRSRKARRPARTDHPADAGLVGPVRFLLGWLVRWLWRRFLRWWRLLRRWRRFGELVTP